VIEDNIIGLNLEKIRKKLRLSTVEMVKMLGLKRVPYSNILNGRRKIDVATLIELENISGIPAKRLFEVELKLDEIPNIPYPKEYEKPDAITGKVEELEQQLNEIKKELKKS